MPWTWRYEDSSGAIVETEPICPRFPAQADAETWIGEIWEDLVELGVDAVTLLEDEREVYGPMSLRPAS